jgi:2-oxo-3-hexenedioate decarboxylase
MKGAQDSVRQIEPFTSRVPAFDLAAAYEVAQRVHEARVSEGAKPLGRKIGFTNPSLFAQYGVRDPIWGYMYDTTVVQLQGTHATCPLGRFADPKIEPEIVLQFRSAPRPGAKPAEILGALGWIAHGFEIVQSHFPGWKFQAPDTVADGGLHAALLIGPPQPVDRLGDDIVTALEAFTVALSCDGTHVETGRGSNVLGSPLAAMAHLLSVLARQPGCPPVQAGDIVTTGTITKAYSIQPGQTWRTEVQGIGLPGLTVEFAQS